jgi:O-antigen biosynthesis protein
MLNWFFKPIIEPSEQQLRQWAKSEWLEYQAWIFQYSFITLNEWRELRAISKSWKYPPLISIITPVYNTPAFYLKECLESVQLQAYPFWEMCLVDDGSSNLEILEILKSYCNLDKRFKFFRFEQNQGICGATNQAIQMASGDYIAFLDHDDRLAPDALFYVAEKISTDQSIDVIYTDRDMISPNNRRFMHLFKPDWSPETLLSGNYLFHLVVYKRQLINQLGGVRKAFEGSQDFDLILRASDNPNLKISHIPRVLYHWRQHAQSVALEHGVKEYMFCSGIFALEETLQRRNLSGTVNENPNLWRGNYQIKLNPLNSNNYQVIQITNPENYIETLLNTHLEKEFVVILSSELKYEEKDINELISWLQIQNVAITTGKIISQDKIVHAGLVQCPNGIPLSLYEGHSSSTAGYMAVTMSVRNVSTPHPFCCAMRSETLKIYCEKLKLYKSSYGIFEIALNLLQQNQRVTYTPFAIFETDETINNWQTSDRELFVNRWKNWLETGDPFYNKNLTLKLNDMGLEF